MLCQQPVWSLLHAEVLIKENSQNLGCQAGDLCDDIMPGLYILTNKIQTTIYGYTGFSNRFSVPIHIYLPFPLFLLLNLNSFHSPPCYFPLLHFTSPFPFFFTYFFHSHSLYLFPFFLSSSFLLYLPCHSSSISCFPSPLPFPFLLSGVSDPYSIEFRSGSRSSQKSQSGSGSRRPLNPDLDPSSFLTLSENNT